MWLLHVYLTSYKEELRASLLLRCTG